MKNVVLNWTGSALGTRETSPDRPTFERLLDYKERHPAWNVHIIVNTDTMDDDNKLIFAEQHRQLEAKGIVVLDTAKSFAELGFYEPLEPYYRRALKEGEGSLAHVMASDLARVAMAWRFRSRSEPVIYLDVDLAVRSLDQAVSNCGFGFLLQGVDVGQSRAAVFHSNNNFFYIDVTPLGAMYLDCLTDLVVASYEAREKRFGDQLFRPERSMVFDYVLSLAGPQTFDQALNLFAYAFSEESRTITGGCSYSHGGVLRGVYRDVGDSNKPSTWVPSVIERTTEPLLADSSTASACLKKKMRAYAESVEEQAKARREREERQLHSRKYADISLWASNGGVLGKGKSQDETLGLHQATKDRKCCVIQ